MYQCRSRTINNENKPAAVVLGGTLPHAELIRRLQARGYYTILIDYFENPPAAKFADAHYRESAMEYETVLAIARECKARLVLSSCLDQQMNIAMRVSEELNLPHPFSSVITKNVTDKKIMKKTMMEHGIPTSKYYVVDTAADLMRMELDYPVIVKPTDGSGSAGVAKIYSADDVPKAIHNAIRFGNGKDAIVEEYAEGSESNIHFTVEDGIPKLLFVTCKIVSMEGSFPRQLCNVYLARPGTELCGKFEKIAGDIVRAFELPAFTPFFMQTKTKNGVAKVLEFSPRIAGGITSDVAKDYVGLNLLDFSVDSYLGIRRHPKRHTASAYVCCYPIYCREGILDHIRGGEQAVQQGIADKMLLLKEPGARISLDKPSNSNAVKFILKGETLHQLYEKIAVLRETVDVIGQAGESLVDHSVVLTEDLLEENVRELL